MHRLETLGGKRVVSQRSALLRSPAGRSWRAVTGAGVVRLVVKAKGLAKRRLDRRGSARVTVVVTFTPTAGTPGTGRASGQFGGNRA